MQNAIICGISINWINRAFVHQTCPETQTNWVSSSEKATETCVKKKCKTCRSVRSNTGPKMHRTSSHKLFGVLPSKSGKNLRSEENGCNYSNSETHSHICSMSVFMYGNIIIPYIYPWIFFKGIQCRLLPIYSIPIWERLGLVNPSFKNQIPKDGAKPRWWQCHVGA